MGEHRRLILMRHGCHLFKKRPGAGILSVKSDKIGVQRIQPIQGMIPLLHLRKRILKSFLPARAAYLDAAHPHLHTGLCGGFRRQIHIKNGSDSTGQVFQHRQPGEMVNHLPVKLRLHRKYLIIQPVGKRQIIRTGTKKCHGGMSVRIFKSGHQKISLTVNFPVPENILYGKGLTNIRSITARPHIKNFVVLHPKFPFYNICCLHGQYFCIVKPVIHIFFPFFLRMPPSSQEPIP